MTGPARRYVEGQIIEYTSFAPSGYSTGQVTGYAAGDDQQRLCLIHGYEPDDPFVYIRARSGSKPFPVRESQLRPKE